MSERPRLNSWKEIASYLERDIRTVIRWEKRRGLPVYRLPGGPRPRVFAYAEELDRWLEQRGGANEEPKPVAVTPDAPGVSPAKADNTASVRRIALTGLGLLVLAAAWSMLARAPGPPQRLMIGGRELLAFDALGAPTWRYPLDATPVGNPPLTSYHIGDLDADGRTEVLASVELQHPSFDQHGGELVALTDRGARLWTFAADDRLTFRDGEYGPPWPAGLLAVYRTARGARLAWSVHHFTWWPSVLITLDPDGNRVGTFVNSGWIRGATPSKDRRHLFLSGITNSRQASFFAVLDAADPTGHSPEPPGGATECVSCSAGNPIQYVVLPRTDVSRQQPFPGEGATVGPTVITFDDGTVQVHVLESAGPNIATTIYDFAPDLTLRGARFGDSFWEWHRRLEAEGRIDHSADACPERAGLEVQRWTRATGWTTHRIEVR